MKALVLVLAAFVGGAAVSSVRAEANREDELCRRFISSPAGQYLKHDADAKSPEDRAVRRSMLLMRSAFCPGSIGPQAGDAVAR